MSVRRNVITGEPVLFAPERAARPRAFAGDDAAHQRCPFCPGHESDTPAEIVRIADGDRWLARAFPNKYPAITGAEVIVESPEHEAQFHSIGHAAEVVRLYAGRYRAHNAPYVALFKNHGAAAGSSIEHLHSQLIPLPFVPARIEREMAAFDRACPLCDAIETHEALMIRESEAFAWLAPSGSWMAYQQWIVPKRHMSEIGEMTGDETADLATFLRDASAASLRVAPAFNWAFINFPRGHFYVDVLPRTTVIAGLELGTGTFVEIMDPARAAETLRR